MRCRFLVILNGATTFWERHSASRFQGVSCGSPAFLFHHVHIPADLDRDQPLKRRFIFDLNFKQRLTAEPVTRMPHPVYLASCQRGELYSSHIT
ncbi:hypothetical protein BJX96DRAFT_142284 [Aspergillus floccosus]